ncbi:MAG TPA: ribosomal protein S18-alanine N-acetyltransferase [Mycobacteriales bacterium]|nr:ribosomal protein S18-alanine N-acetyltransferase [Mycobacteriales bacterium]
MTALRPMRWWDIEPVVALEDALFDDAWNAEMFWDELAQGETRTYVVATDGDGVVGYAGLAAMPDEAYVQTIGVAPSHQRRGIGSVLLRALLDDARDRGLGRVGLEVRVDNAPAIAMYERFGFRGIAVRKRYYQPSGTDALVMVTA